MSKSLSKNVSLNVIKTIINFVFPLITYPYIARVLGVENVGKYNFAASIVGYLSLTAGFGIGSYAVREGARIKSDKNAMELFARQIFSINLLSTLVAYIVMAILLLIFPKISIYAVLIMIQSAAIIGGAVAAEWLNVIYEDFGYITVRTIAFKIVAFVLMFVFVRSETDLYFFAATDVVASVGAAICNFFYCRRYVKLKPTTALNLRTHFPPLFTFWCSNLTATIYVNSDQTMLGIICGDFCVGAYSVAVKLYNIIKSVISSILTVILPRISSLNGNTYAQERKRLAEYTLKAILVLSVPFAIGIYSTAENIILIIAGEPYLAGTESLKILAASVIAASLALFMTNVYVVPGGFEKILIISSTISALLNVALNFIMIPMWQHNGAAWTTFLSEMTVFLIEFIYVKPDMDYKSIGKVLIQLVAAGGCMLLPIHIIGGLGLHFALATVLQVLAGATTYFLCLALMKNEIMCDLFSKVKKQLRK